MLRVHCLDIQLLRPLSFEKRSSWIALQTYSIKVAPAYKAHNILAMLLYLSSFGLVNIRNILLRLSSSSPSPSAVGPNDIIPVLVVTPTSVKRNASAGHILHFHSWERDGTRTGVEQIINRKHRSSCRQ